VNNRRKGKQKRKGKKQEMNVKKNHEEMGKLMKNNWNENGNDDRRQ